MTLAAVSRGARMAAAARHMVLLLIFSLAFMQPELRLLELPAVPTDLVYLVLLALSIAALATGGIRFDWHPAYGLLLLYFAAMALSLAVSSDPVRSSVKLATQVYLLSLPVLVSSLITTEYDLRRAMRAWLAGSVVVVAVGIVSLFLFYTGQGQPILKYTQNIYGTMPSGPYPRLRLTFVYANLLCNYLTVSLLIVLITRQKQWIGRGVFLALALGISICLLFSVSPGLGGVLLGVGIWAWLSLRATRPRLALLGLMTGLSGAILFLVVMTVTPIIHRTAPFLIPVSGTDLTLAPSVRLMVWMDAVRNFLTNPLLGRGIGMDAVDVPFQIPAGDMARLTDAHNGFLNIAVQCGLVGLAAFLPLLVWTGRRLLPLRLHDRNLLTLGLGLAFLNVLAFQGLGGSFEDSRHIWVLFGLFLAAIRIERIGSGEPTEALRSAPELGASPA